MRRPPQRATRTYTLIPDATLVRSTSERSSQSGARYQYPMSFGDAEILVRATPPQDGIPREGVVDPIVDQSFVDVDRDDLPKDHPGVRSEEHTSELQSLMRISYAVFCLQNTKQTRVHKQH